MNFAFFAAMKFPPKIQYALNNERAVPIIEMLISLFVPPIEYIGPAGYEDHGPPVDGVPNNLIQIENTTDSYSDEPSDDDNIPTIDTDGT